MKRNPTGARAMALATLLLTPWARAQGDARRELVQRGVTARDAGDHSTALALFEQAGALEMRPGLRLSIAQEQQALGRALPACETASQCVAELQASLGSPESARILPACAEVAAVSCRGFARVRIAVPHGLPAGSALRVQGRAVPVTNDEASAFVAAGAVRVELVREGRPTLTREIEVTAGAVSTVSLGDDATANASGAIPPQPVGGEAPRAASVAPTPHPATPHPATSARAPVTSQWWFWTLIAVVAVGGTMGGLAAGGVFDRTAAPPAGVNYSVNALQGW